MGPLALSIERERLVEHLTIDGDVSAEDLAALRQTAGGNPQIAAALEERARAGAAETIERFRRVQSAVHISLREPTPSNVRAVMGSYHRYRLQQLWKMGDIDAAVSLCAELLSNPRSGTAVLDYVSRNACQTPKTVELVKSVLDNLSDEDLAALPERARRIMAEQLQFTPVGPWLRRLGALDQRILYQNGAVLHLHALRPDSAILMKELLDLDFWRGVATIRAAIDQPFLDKMSPQQADELAGIAVAFAFLATDEQLRALQPQFGWLRPVAGSPLVRGILHRSSFNSELAVPSIAQSLVYLMRKHRNVGALLMGEVVREIHADLARGWPPDLADDLADAVLSELRDDEARALPAETRSILLLALGNDETAHAQARARLQQRASTPAQPR